MPFDQVVFCTSGRASGVYCLAESVTVCGSFAPAQHHRPPYASAHESLSAAIHNRNRWESVVFPVNHSV
eukprot:scaffold269880_cov20-Prasinocladus_malaysianus.AAC.2